MGFLDSVSDTFNRGKDAAGRTGARIKLNNRISEINRNRQSLITQLGASLYEVTKNDPALRAGREALYDGIAALDQERDMCMQQLAEVEAAAQTAEFTSTVYSCAVCGAPIRGGDLFCSSCGAPAEQAIPRQPAPVAAGAVANSFPCPHCGAPVAEGHKFCMSCGKPIETADQAQPTEAEEQA